MVSSNYVRLTGDLQSKKGSLWNQVVCNIGFDVKLMKHDSRAIFLFQPCMTRNWELNVQFKVHGNAKELFGDGLVLWYVKDRMVQGPVFGSKDYFSGLAIILDTYSNHNGPHNVSKIQRYSGLPQYIIIVLLDPI